MKGKVGAVVVGVAIVGALAGTAMCATRIPVGYDGVAFGLNGVVDDEILDQGWHIVSPTKKVKKFTIGNEQLLLTKDEREGSEGDDSFKVSTADDANIAISFQMSYRFKEDTLVDTYKRFKGMDGEDIVNKRVRTVLKSKVSEVTTSHSMMDIYSGDRAQINEEITDYLDKTFGKSYGLEVLDASIVDVHPDEKLKEAIDNRVTALQKKQQAQAEQETVKVEAETALIKAENEAKIKVTEATAEATANKVKAESITDELIRMTEAEARKDHGWVTVQGADAVVANGKE